MIVRRLCVCFLFHQCLYLGVFSSGAKIPLFIGYLQELSDLPQWYEKAKFFPQIVDYALEVVRNRTDILLEYDIQIILKDLKYLYSGVFSSGAKIPLFIGYLQELSDLPRWYEKAKFFPQIVEYALSVVRNRTDILPEYDIQIILKDLKFTGGYGSKMLIELLDEEPEKVAILGPAHGTIVTFTGQIAPIYNIIELFFGESTHKFDLDSEDYSTLFNVNQETKELNSLRIEMMKYFGWSRIGTIARDGDNWKYQIDHLHELLDMNNMTLISAASITHHRSSRDILRTFKQFEVKIIMAAFMGDQARDLFCEAYHQGLYGNGYVWVISGPTMFDDKIIADAKPEEMTCTIEELLMVSDGHFMVNYKYVSNSKEPTISGETPEQIMDTLIYMNSKTPYKLDKHASVLYDTVWALCLGLNNSIKYLEEKGLRLHEYDYLNPMYLEGVMAGMHEVQFIGASGPVSFDEKRNRIGLTYIQQVFNDSVIDVASYNPRLGNITWLVPIATLWPGQDVPKDRFTYEAIPVSSSTVAVAMVILIDVIGVILSSTFLAYNVYHRKNRFIKMSSPMLNNVIIAGSFLFYIEVLLSAADYNSHMTVRLGGHMCMIHTWLKVIGFTVLFGALFSKTYRVYVIFRNSQLKSKIVKDAHLCLIVGIMLVIDLLILLPWTITDPLVKERYYAEVKNRKDNNVIFTEMYIHCSCSYLVYWVAATYVYKGLLLAFGMFLAWETRQVNVPALNDSKYIGACIYNVVIVCIFGVPLAHVLPVQEATLSFVLESCLILFCTIICLCIIFIPKIQMRKQVHGRFVTEQMTTRMNSSRQLTIDTIAKNGEPVNEAASTSSSPNKTIPEIMEENKALRMQVAGETIAIAKLRKSLIEMTGNIHFYKAGTEYVLFKTDGPDTSGCSNPNVHKKHK